MHLEGTYGRQTWKILMWGSLAYFWSLINDAPLNADTLLGQSWSGYLIMEVVLNLLSFLCFCLAVREATKGRDFSGTAVLWTLLAILWSSADDIPFVALWLGPLRTQFWYPFDAAIHAVSLVFFYLAVRAPSTQSA
jgi:hypothetical protein